MADNDAVSSTGPQLYCSIHGKVTGEKLGKQLTFHRKLGTAFAFAKDLNDHWRRRWLSIDSKHGLRMHILIVLRCDRVEMMAEIGMMLGN